MHIRKNSFFLFILFLLLRQFAMAQQPALKDYIVLTVEHSFSKGGEGLHRYYWIIETDSIKSSAVRLRPLMLDGYTKADLNDCCKGDTIDPYFLNPHDTTSKFDREYFVEIEHLGKLISSNKKMLEHIVKDWPLKDLKEQTDFYITPIRGRFCATEFGITGPWRTGYSGKIVLPYSSFELNMAFFDSDLVPKISMHDFSDLKYWLLK
jgi:hypothetical protein